MITTQQQQPQAPQPTAQAQSTAPFQSASLYVGDLHNEVTEGLLFELFNRVGPVASIRVCRDAVTRRSLGYAYVNFHNVQDAERALDTMNFTDIKGRPCRIMWSQRDPSLRKSGVGNVFVKNLAPTVDNKGLFDTFSVFGNILSCKVANDENGASKGYGYVHYETAEAAQDAIQKFNGNSIDEYEVFVGPFVRRQERAGQSNWTNLYVKQFPVTWDEAKIKEIFSEFGQVASVFVQREDTKSKGFGFVNFVEHESAEKALKELANKSFEDPTEGTTFELYVNKAQKKTDRSREIVYRMNAIKEERVSRFQGMNLYVKNLDDTITDEFFRETFAKYGTITSARIMRDTADNASKGFGFVCFSSPEEATRAVSDLNGKILRSKPIVVTLHQRKELRRAHLAATYAPRNMRFPPGPTGMPMPYMPMYVPQPGQQSFPPQRTFSFPGQQYPPRTTSPRGLPMGRSGSAPGQGGFYPVPPYGGPQQMGGPMGQQQFNKRMIPQNAQAMPMQGQQGMQRRTGPGMQGPGMVPGGRGGPGVRPYGMPQMGQQQQPGLGMQQQRGPVSAGVKFNSNVRNQGGVMTGPQGVSQSMPMASMTVPGLGEPLDDQALAQADPQMQKNMIGERLYPLIYVHQQDLAGKITGMLLEMDNAELLNLIESPDALMHKIEEALIVLKNHQSVE